MLSQNNVHGLHAAVPVNPDPAAVAVTPPRARNTSYDPVSTRSDDPDGDGFNNNRNQRNDSSSPKQFTDYAWKACTMFGIPIYIHYLLPIFFILSMFFWARVYSKDTEHFVYYLLLIICQNVLLWWTVFIHELGHAYAAYLVGGHTDKILLWPLGGLACSQPPLHPLPRRSNRCAQLWISLGGPLTHIPHMVLWGTLLYFCGQHPHGCTTRTQSECVYQTNPFAIKETWTETIFTPIESWIDYDFFMLAFTLNVWLFVVNLVLPAYPLDGSKVFANLVRAKYGLRTTAQIYCVANGVIGIAFIVVANTLLNSGSMLQFAGLWGVFQVYVMVQFITAGREFAHPLLVEK